MVYIPSFRDFTRSTLIYKLLDDIKEHRIFNEADMQYRAAVHIDKECYPDLYLTNQPVIPVGRGRGKYEARPDIVIFHPKKGPMAAIELKSFLYFDYDIKSIIEAVWNDIEKLKRFKARYPESKNTFVVVCVNINDIDDFWEINGEFNGEKENWMKYYFYPHIINVFCDNNGRKRNWYNKWSEEWSDLKDYISDRR